MGDNSNPKAKSTVAEKNKNLFVLPNGSYLRYECITRGRNPGSQDKWKIGYDLPFFWQRAKLKKKESQPKLGLWSSRSKQHLICADFDKEPPGFPAFDDLYNYIKNNYGSKSIVLKSSSGRVKVLFLIEKNTLEMPTHQEAITCLEKIDPFFSEYADKQGTALSITFVNEQMANTIAQQLPLLPVILKFTAQEKDHSKSGIAKNLKVSKPTKKPLIFYEGELPSSLNQFIGHYNSKSKKERERFIRFILGNPKVPLKKIALPIILISDLTGTSKMNISRWIDQLCDMRWLTIVSKETRKGEKARTFKANGLLKSVCQSILGLNTSENQYIPPTFIPDGQWNYQIYRAVVSVVEKSPG